MHPAHGHCGAMLRAVALQRFSSSSGCSVSVVELLCSQSWLHVFKVLCCHCLLVGALVEVKQLCFRMRLGNISVNDCLGVLWAAGQSCAYVELHWAVLCPPCSLSVPREPFSQPLLAKPGGFWCEHSLLEIAPRIKGWEQCFHRSSGACCWAAWSHGVRVALGWDVCVGRRSGAAQRSGREGWGAARGSKASAWPKGVSALRK